MFILSNILYYHREWKKKKQSITIEEPKPIGESLAEVSSLEEKEGTTTIKTAAVMTRLGEAEALLTTNEPVGTDNRLLEKKEGE